jgi:alkanesulfonate monooxygenase SsuD/methylene tetrahydromethanopterin reductase-like flavin-dependent oxidoreductase (luciferase family)
MSFHYHVAETDAQAEAEAEEPMREYVQLFRESASAWQGRASAAYPGYEGLVRGLDSISYERVLRETRAFIGSPDTVERQIRFVLELFGAVEPSLQVLYGNMPYGQAERSLRLFADEVMPRFQRAEAQQGHRAEGAMAEVGREGRRSGPRDG